MDRLEEKSWVENPGDRVVHDYPKKIRFHPLQNVMAWKTLHTTDYISKKMRKYKDEDAKHMAIDIFLSRNSNKIPGYFDELLTTDEVSRRFFRFHFKVGTIFLPHVSRIEKNTYILI